MKRMYAPIRIGDALDAMLTELASRSRLRNEEAPGAAGTVAEGQTPKGPIS